jgi:hypothetical protein
LSRLALDQLIEGERTSEAIAALLVVQWRHFNLAGQQLPQQLACMGSVPAKERLDVPKARLEHLLQPRQIGGSPVSEAGPFELSDQPGLPGLLGVQATDHLVLGGLPIGEDVQKPADAAFDLVEVSFF